MQAENDNMQQRINREQAHTKHTAKDSVFTLLFSDVENVYKLYRSLHPEMLNITVDDINIKTIDVPIKS